MNGETDIKPTTNEYLDENGHFKEGNPGGGRKPDTPEQKLQKKAIKQLVEEYKEALASYLPQVEPIFMAKVLEGDTASIKEYHDRVLDKAKQATDITTNGKDLPVPILQTVNQDVI
jgi:hypothetical protein